MNTNVQTAESWFWAVIVTDTVLTVALFVIIVAVLFWQKIIIF